MKMRFSSHPADTSINFTVTEFEVPEDSLRQAVLICSDLGAASSPIIRSLASATLRQLLTGLYERVETSVLANPSEHLRCSSMSPETPSTTSNPTCTTPKAKAGPASPPTRATRGGRARDSLTPPSDLTGTSKHAYMLFQDLCLMGKGESGVWLGHASMSRVVAMELIEELLGSHPNLFHASAAFGDAIKHTYALSSSNLCAPADFSLMVRSCVSWHCWSSSFTSCLQLSVRFCDSAAQDDSTP